MFRKQRYSSPSQKRTYQADLPTGYHGQFGSGVRSWVLALYYAAGMSEPKILELLRTVGMHISAGPMSTFLIANHSTFHAEYASVVQAGLASSPWQHLDSTGTLLNGKNGLFRTFRAKLHYGQDDLSYNNSNPFHSSIPP